MPINSSRFGLARFNESERWKEAGTDAGSGFPDGHNDLVDSYDMLAVETDLHTNRPGTGTYDDELFLSTDRRTLYRWENDSSTWNETAGHGTAANPVSDTVHLTTLAYGSELQDGSATTVLGQSAASGNVTLSSGAATIDTGVGQGTLATFFVALGPETDDSEVAASIQANSGGNYTVHLDEINTSVGNPTVEYDIVRVR